MTLDTTEPAVEREDRCTKVVANPRSTFDAGVTRPYEWRVRQLRGLAKLLDERGSDIAEALSADLRRSPIEAGLFDVGPTKAELAHARKQLRRWMRPHRVRAPVKILPGRAWYQHEPVGVVLIIAPWNYPVHLALTPLISALAAGNCAVLKPSEITAACSALLADLLPRYLDPTAVAVVEGGAEASLGLLDEKVDHCFFTGSPAVGSAIMTAAARHLTPVTLELGGKCPAIVTASADLEVAARRIAFGKLANSGQTCVAPDYVLVDRRVRDVFVEKVTATVRNFSEDRAVPIVNTRHAARVAELIRDAGGRVALGGEVDVEVDVEATLAKPTVIVDPRPDSALMRDEIFGPVLPVVTVDSLDEALAHVRRGDRPLASYLFTEDREDEQRILADVITGGIVINHVLLHLGVTNCRSAASVPAAWAAITAAGDSRPSATPWPFCASPAVRTSRCSTRPTRGLPRRSWKRCRDQPGMSLIAAASPISSR